MRLRTNAGAGLAVVAAVCACLAGCRPDTAFQPKQRPPMVPDTAVFAGPGDGTGHYMDCSYGTQTNICRVWAGNSGELMVTKEFVLQPENRPAKSEELQFAGYDGQKIHLKSGQVLVPLR